MVQFWKLLQEAFQRLCVWFMLISKSVWMTNVFRKEKRLNSRNYPIIKCPFVEENWQTVLVWSVSFSNTLLIVYNLQKLATRALKLLVICMIQSMGKVKPTFLVLVLTIEFQSGKSQENLHLNTHSYWYDIFSSLPYKKNLENRLRVRHATFGVHGSLRVPLPSPTPSLHQLMSGLAYKKHARVIIIHDPSIIHNRLL